MHEGELSDARRKGAAVQRVALDAPEDGHAVAASWVLRELRPIAFEIDQGPRRPPLVDGEGTPRVHPSGGAPKAASSRVYDSKD